MKLNKQKKSFLYCFLFSLLFDRVRVRVFDFILIIYFVCVFVSVHRRAQETKASWVGQLHFSMIFWFCFRMQFFFTFLILFLCGSASNSGIEGKDCIKVYLGMCINFSFEYYLFIYFLILKFLLDYVDLIFFFFGFVFFGFIVMFCLHALVVNTSEKMFG